MPKESRNPNDKRGVAKMAVIGTFGIVSSFVIGASTFRIAF
jgi:hypothetical protein